MNFLQMNLDNAPWIWFVLTGVATLGGALGIPKIWEIIKDDKCDKRINKLKSAVMASLSMTDLLLTTLESEFSDKSNLKNAIEQVRAEVKKTREQLSKDE